MTVKTQIQSDQSVFLNINESPGAVTAVHTPKGGIAQPSFTVLFVDFPIHGDEEQVLEVEGPITNVVGKSSDLAAIKKNDGILINSINYEVINNPYPSQANNFWSVLNLRLVEETLI